MFDKNVNISKIRIPVFEINQPVGKFYVGKMKHSQLVSLCSKDLSSIDNNDIHNVYQRKLDKKRLPALNSYVHYVRATFPSGVILNSNKPLNFNGNEIIIDNEPDAFFIIDGQHRIEGLKFLDSDCDFEMCVIIFNHVSTELQAEIFSTVNSEAKPVNASVKINLKGNDTIDTPERIVRRIAIAFNDKPGSPLYHRINFSDNSVLADDCIISLATFCRPILVNMYNTDFAFDIKNILLTNSNQREALNNINSAGTGKLFWYYYVNEQEELLYIILKNYFDALKTVFPIDWSNSNSILTKSTGITALINLLVKILRTNPIDMSYVALVDKLKTLQSLEGTFTVQEYGVGASASLKLCKKLAGMLDLPEIVTSTDELNYHMIVE